MWAWIPMLIEWGKKFLSGFFPTSGEKTGKIMWVGLIALAVLLIFNFFQKSQKTEQTFTGTTTVINDNPQAKYSHFGCTLGHIRAGIQWNW